jgi:hypothetical protein
MFAPHRQEGAARRCRSRDAIESGGSPQRRAGGLEVRILEAAQASIRKQGEPIFLERGA